VGGEPQVVRELKRDELGRVELLDGPCGLLVRRVASGGRLPFSGAVARALAARERRALARLEGVRGVPRLAERADYARAPALDGSVPHEGQVLLRTWIEGRPLWAADELARDFFERLAELVGELHARGVCHNDLHKEPNVLVASDGTPAVVDFQLASVHPRRGRGFEVRCAEDRRHVEKHARRYRVATGIESAARAERGPRRSLTARLWMRCGKPLYNRFVRGFLTSETGESRRDPRGPWPRWTAPLGSPVREVRPREVRQ